jgi:F-type H+-transporting ATPase subunit beta
LSPSLRAAKSARSAAQVSAQTVVILELINNIAKNHGASPSSRASASDRAEGNDLYTEMSEAGVIDQKDLSKSKVARSLRTR